MADICRASDDEDDDDDVSMWRWQMAASKKRLLLEELEKGWMEKEKKRNPLVSRCVYLNQAFGAH